MTSDVGLCGAEDAFAFAKSDGILGRIERMAGLHFDEDKDVAVAGDDVDFPVFRAIAGCDDAIAERTKIVDREDLGFAAEAEEPVEKQRKWH